MFEIRVETESFLRDLSRIYKGRQYDNKQIKNNVEEFLGKEIGFEIVNMKQYAEKIVNGNKYAIIFKSGRRCSATTGFIEKQDRLWIGEVDDLDVRYANQFLNEAVDAWCKDYKGDKSKPCYHRGRVVGYIDDGFKGYVVTGIHTKENYEECEYIYIVQSLEDIYNLELKLKHSDYEYARSAAVGYLPDPHYLKELVNWDKSKKYIAFIHSNIKSTNLIYKNDISDYHINPCKDFIDIQALGCNKKSCFYLTNYLKTIFEMPMSHPKANIDALAPEIYWAEHFPDAKGRIDYAAVRRHLLNATARVGNFDPARMRGSGYFMNEMGKPYARSENITYGDQDPKVKHIYGEKFYIPEAAPKFEDIKKKVHELIDIAKCFRWKKGFEENGAMLVAWCLLAPFSACLEYRPHIWINGLSHSGKTWIFGHFIKELMRGFCVTPGGNSTLYGITEGLNGSVKAIVHDEFETEIKASSDEKMKLIEFFRMCATADTDGSLALYKGTASGNALNTVQPVSMVALGSVQSCLERDVDQSRFLMLGLDKKIHNAKDFARAKKWVRNNFLSVIQRQSINYIFKHFDDLEEYISLKEDAFAEKYEEKSSHLSRLMAGLCGFLDFYHYEYDETYVERVLDDFNDNVVREDKRCLKHLLHTDFRLDNQFTNLYTVIREAYEMRLGDRNSANVTRRRMIDCGAYVKQSAFAPKFLDLYLNLDNDILTYKVMSSYPARNWKSILKASDLVEVRRRNVVMVPKYLDARHNKEVFDGEEF